MSKVYCQNNLCPFWKKSKLFSNYGNCKKKEVFMTWQTGDEYEVSGYNCKCKYSNQDREMGVCNNE